MPLWSGKFSRKRRPQGLKNQQQARQAKRLEAGKRQLAAEKEQSRGAIRLTPDAKLSGADKRRLAASFAKAKKDGKIPRTAQQTIPYKEMRRDGICVVSDHYFTKQIQFFDINYQLGATRSRTIATPLTKSLRTSVHVVSKNGGLLASAEVTTYTLKSGMKG